ncbi:GntR family transcriptional regulator [Olsenella sp. HMSC062G07]|uniref:GntR family transcriptional regulator n=1 Tax=Olsenella sp. HMSC062G07 TaxID=1739330 RepID=UPI0008A12590|nr:GntR family transcriptional regulator [Olsenella sp. HMSC062G07]OFK23247.1 hypothetical protein HMPREF2826_05565 [Olsenella sp. HMSC062G07]
MFLGIDKFKERPVYLQIRDQIVAGIASGELQPQDRLPSVRTLASDLGVNLHTVNRAYAVLRDEGFVVMRGRQGALVADVPSPGPIAELTSAQARKASALVGRLATEWRASGGDQEAFVRLVTEAAQAAFTRGGKTS